MKPILIFNDKLDLHKEELLQTIVDGLKRHFVNVASYNKIIEAQAPLILSFDPNSKLAAIFFSDVKQYSDVLKMAFKETITIQKGNLLESIYTPQLVFICDYPKADIPENDISLYHVISIE
jgi:hypothetical protein